MAASTATRRRRWPATLRGRLMASYLAVTLLVLATVDILALTYLVRSSIAQRRENLVRDARVVAGVSSQYMLKGHDYLEYIARDYGRQVGARVLILDGGGKVLQDSFYDPAMPGTELGRRPEVAAALKGRTADQLARVADAGRTLYAAAPVVNGVRVVGAVLVVQLAESVWSEVAPIRNILLLVSLAALALSVGAGWLLAASLARPVMVVTAGVQAVEAGDLSYRVPVPGPDELGRLAEAFNHMSEQLGRIEESRRTFVANAAHELRTPLASLRALVEPLLSGAVADPAEQAEFLADIGREVDRLAELTDDLLTLSELEAGRPLQIEEMDLAGLLRRVRTRLLPVAREAGVEIAVTAPPAAIIRADPRRLERALYNLVQNAITFSPPGGVVRLAAGTVADGVAISVADQGPGVPEADQPRIFERFYRSESSRSRERGGAGLGLAIVREIIHHHGGEIRVHSQPGEGTSFVAVLPSSS